jgi:transcriptional regulator with XRE-family HTH domain
MTTHVDPWLAGKRLRGTLRKEREARELTQRQAADALDWSTSKIVRIEAGTVGVSTTDVQALLRLYRVNGEAEAGRLVDLARAARRRPWYSQYQQVLNPGFEQYLGYEGGASAIMAFHPLTIPGLLQTEDYARAILEADHVPDIDTRLELRLARQARMERDNRPLLRYIIDEAALHRRVGGQLVMRDQLTQLKKTTSHPTVSLQVIPFAAGAHPSMTGSFTILEFGEDDDDVLYRESTQTSVTDRDDRTAVNSYRERFDQLSNISLPAGEATELIDTLINNLQDTAQAHEPR